MNIVFSEVLLNGDSECTKFLLKTLSGIALSLANRNTERVTYYLHKSIFFSLGLVFDESGQVNNIGPISFDGITVPLRTNQIIRPYPIYKILENERRRVPKRKVTTESGAQPLDS